MFNFGLFELLLFGVIALIVLGPDKLPVAARWLGKWYAIAVHTKNKLTQNVMSELQLLEAQEQIQKELAKLKQSEAKIQAQMHALQNEINKNRNKILTFHEENQTADKSHHSNNTANTTPLVTDSPDNHHTNPSDHHVLNTRPMMGQFFLLGDYDKRRRLPNAPKLPNYTADILLNHHTTTKDN